MESSHFASSNPILSFEIRFRIFENKVVAEVTQTDSSCDLFIGSTGLDSVGTLSVYTCSAFLIYLEIPVYVGQTVHWQYDVV